MKILGLGHYSRTGKDTVADKLMELGEMGGLKVRKIPLAWKLKEVCHELYAWDGLQGPAFYDSPENEHLRDVPLPTVGKTPVEIWVAVGHELRNGVYEHTWLDHLLKSDHDCDLLVVPDVRYPNEANRFKELGAIIAKVVRPGFGPRKTKADVQLVGYDGWHYVIGGGGLRELDTWANRFYKHFKFGAPITQEVDQRKEILSRENLSGIADFIRQLAC